MQLGAEQTIFLFVSFYKPSQLSPSSCLELLIKRVHSRNVKEYEDKIRSTFGALSSPFFRVTKKIQAILQRNHLIPSHIK